MGLFRGKKKRQEVVLYTYPKLVFTWLLILAGFAFWFVAGWQIIQPEALGWIYGIILILTLITVSIDVDRNAAAFWAVVIVACWVIVLYLRDVKALTIFALIYTFFCRSRRYLLQGLRYTSQYSTDHSILHHAVLDTSQQQMANHS